MDKAIKRAIEEAGGPTALSRAISEVTSETITPQAISLWKICPVKWALPVARITGVKHHELRPDIYPPPVKRKAKSRNFKKAKKSKRARA